VLHASKQVCDLPCCTQQAGLLAPGKNRLSVHYKGTTYTAGLSRPGTILYEGIT